ncbi:MAG: hypothetical protein K0S65_5734 [Labilithrix sp.]|nr:hypothetical protein [Labilithrix sp.]
MSQTRPQKSLGVRAKSAAWPGVWGLAQERRLKATTRLLWFPLVSTVSTTTLALLAACGGATLEDASPGTGTDSGAPGPSTSESRPDAAPQVDAEAGVKPKLLVSGDVVLHGVTMDDHAVYTRRTAQGDTLEAIRLVDGQTSVIWGDVPKNASVRVEGNVAGIWTNIDASGRGTFSYWATQLTSARLSMAHLSMRDRFWASRDGTRVAFFAKAVGPNGAPTTAELNVLATSTGVQVTVLKDAERVSLETSCIPQIGFGGETLIAAYCTEGSTSARLVTVADDTVPMRQVMFDGGLRPFWSASASGREIFVIAVDRDAGFLVTNRPLDPRPPVALSAGIKEGFLLADGSSVVYRAFETLWRSPILGGEPQSPTPFIGDVRGILDVSIDRETVLYRSMDGRPVDPTNPDGERYFDLRSIPTRSNDWTPRVLVDTERALPLSLSGNGAHALYFANGPKLIGAATDGSGERTVPVDFNGMKVTPYGSSAVLSVNPRQLGPKAIVDLVHVSFGANGLGGALAPKPLAQSLGSGGYHFASALAKTLVYARVSEKDPGLYSVALP